MAQISTQSNPKTVSAVASVISSKHAEAQKIAKMKLFDDFRLQLEKMKTEFIENYSEGPKRKTDTTINFQDFDIVNTLGQGSFGCVVCICLWLGTRSILCKHRASNNFYAVKIMNKAKILKDKQFDHTLNEKQILCSVNFPFLIHMEFSFKDNCNIFFVLPFIAGGDMFSLLRKNKCFKEKDAKFYAAQVVLAIEYLHYMDILYRDLKPENIVVDTNGYLKITDFGFCKIVKLRTYTLCGTPEYLAPEIILSKGYGKSVDWWSLGIFLYEMIAGFTPFYAEEAMKIYEKITIGKYRFTSNFSTEARDLIKNILQVDLSRRYGVLKNGALDIKTHEWFQAINWNAVFSCTASAPYVPIVESPQDTKFFQKYKTPVLETFPTEKYAGTFDAF